MIKQVIIVRKDLNMRKGKIAAQVAHASMKVILDKMIPFDLSEVSGKLLPILKDSPFDLWINGLFTKVVVGCNSEEELLNYYTLAMIKGLPCALITDSGLTEFHGEQTKTCVAIGPEHSEKIDEITGKLKLL